MKLVVLGLSLSSSWGNGHAVTYRALLRALAARGHDILFLERETPWYAAARDVLEPDYCRLAFYGAVAELERWRREIETADAVMVGSFTPEGLAVGRWVQEAALGVRIFYDIDTPVTLAALERDACEYLSSELIGGYDLYLSFTGGPTLEALEQRWGAPAARVLYCSADPELHRPIEQDKRWDLAYLGTYGPDRQAALEKLLLEPARQAPDLAFVVAGSLYPETIDWPANVERIEHVAPGDHPAFYAQSRFTLNVTRADMVRAGFSPSVRLFEAALCGCPILSDSWPGLSTLFKPGAEIAVVESAEAVLSLLRHVDGDRRHAWAAAARRRALDAHTAAHRAGELEALIEAAALSPSASVAFRPAVA